MSGNTIEEIEPIKFTIDPRISFISYRKTYLATVNYAAQTLTGITEIKTD